VTKIIISTNDGAILEIRPNHAAVVYADDNATITDMLNDPADNPMMSVADAWEQLTWTDDDGEGPDFDTVSKYGFDGTGRTEGRITWRMLAEKLMAREPEPPMIDDIVAAGMTPPEDGEYVEWKDIAAHLQERMDTLKQLTRELYHDAHTVNEFVKGAI
jgi:hypothetical protein